MIKPADLHKVWAAPDNTRLTKQQLSFRLPLHVAAKLAALCEMYPEKTRTQLVGDLLSTALEDFERSFPNIKGRKFGTDPDTGETLYNDVGPGREYRELANRHYEAMERELGNESPRPLFPGLVITDKDVKGD